MTERERLRRNPILLCVYRALQMSLFPIAVITIFWQREIGLSMAEIFILQALFAAITGLLEFPSGYVADRVGYRTTLIAAAGLTLVGWTVYFFSPSFWSIAVAEIFLGAGLSLISGTDAALLYESLLESDRESEFALWNGRIRFFGQAAEGSAALLAGLLYAVSPRLPFALELLAWAAAAGVAWALAEPTRHRAAVSDAWSHMGRIVRGVVGGPRRLRAVMTLTIALSLGSFVPVWIIQLYTESAGVPVAWLGPIWAAANYTVALTALASDRLGRMLGLLPSLLLCVGSMAAGYLGLGLTQAWWGFAFYFLITAMRGLNGPILHHEEQRLIPSTDRAAFLSVRSLGFRLAFVVVGPWVGWGIDRHGDHVVLLISGAALTVVCSAAWVWLARSPEAQIASATERG